MSETAVGARRRANGHRTGIGSGGSRVKVRPKHHFPLEGETDMTKKRKLLLAALAAAPISCAVPAFAALDVYVDAPPPAARYEVVPAPRAGFVWQPGYWDWSHGRHAWHKGYWVK